MKIIIKKDCEGVLQALKSNQVDKRALDWFYDKFGWRAVGEIVKDLRSISSLMVLCETGWKEAKCDHAGYNVYTVSSDFVYELEPEYPEKFMTNRNKSSCWNLKEGEHGSVSVFRQYGGKDHSEVVLSSHSQFFRNYQGIHEVSKEEFDSILLKVLDNAPKLLAPYGLMEYYPETYCKDSDGFLWYYKEGVKQGRFWYNGLTPYWVDSTEVRADINHISITKEEFLELASKSKGWEEEAKLGGFPLEDTIEVWLMKMPSWLSTLAIKNTKVDVIASIRCDSRSN